MILIDGKEVASKIKENIRRIILNNNLSLTLVVLQIGNDEASNIYIKQKALVAEYLNINFEHLKFDENANEEEILSKINELNNSENITGVIVQLPLPSKFNKNKIINAIDPLKDVDGLTDTNVLNLINNKKGLTPSTPTGIIELLKHYNISVNGKNIVIIGRGQLVGKPLTNMLLNMDATVSVCHSKTLNLYKYTQKADIIVSATGHKHLIKKDMVKNGSVVIDVGISKENGKLYGDVDFDNVKDIASYITPVPGGVGPMTVVMLMNNVVKSFHLRKNES